MRATVRVEQSRAEFLQPGDAFRIQHPVDGRWMEWCTLERSEESDARAVMLVTQHGASIHANRLQLCEVQRTDEDEVLRLPEGCTGFWRRIPNWRPPVSYGLVRELEVAVLEHDDRDLCPVHEPALVRAEEESRG